MKKFALLVLALLFATTSLIAAGMKSDASPQGAFLSAPTPAPVLAPIEPQVPASAVTPAATPAASASATGPIPAMSALSGNPCPIPSRLLLQPTQEEMLECFQKNFKRVDEVCTGHRLIKILRDCKLGNEVTLLARVLNPTTLALLNKYYEYAKDCKKAGVSAQILTQFHIVLYQWCLRVVLTESLLHAEKECGAPVRPIILEALKCIGCPNSTWQLKHRDFAGRITQQELNDLVERRSAFLSGKF